jgi:glutamate dehydrogenase
MGITAKGAWELVMKRFRDLGLDTQSQQFTVVGVGDMSGDVFGNGMLLSRHIKLVAAFDHRHIFIDPAPDAASSFAERRRLFELPRSSWADYDAGLISAGGGVFDRTLKSVPVSPEARAALGLSEAIEALMPAELMKAILKAPVDLFWNGGIGTYVKASGETHVDVGDKANDAIRINGRDLRANVVGEGGNLGLTQLGRIEYARFGGRDGVGGQVASDFIDNSAGVDCSDHEVNIKILLGRAIIAGDLAEGDRNDLLAAMTDEVGELVLRDNYDQAIALGNAMSQAHSLLPVHRRLISELERRGALDRELEDLPSDEELALRGERGGGLTTPEFAVLLAYVKIVLEKEILDSSVPDEPWTTAILRDYFPTPLRERFAAHMAEHPLRREIITTVLVNEAVNRSGTSFFYRATDETGATWADVLRAYVVVREVYGLRDLWKAAEALDNKVPTDAQTLVYLEGRRLIDRSVRWIVSNRRSPIDVTGEIARIKPGIEALLPQLDSLFRGGERESVRRHAAAMAEAGLPRELAEWATRLMYGFGLLDVNEVAHNTGQPLEDVAPVYFVLSERFRADDLLSRISGLPRADRWQTLARMALRYDLYAALAGLTQEVLTGTSTDAGAEERVQEWEQTNAASIARARTAIGELEGSGDLAALSVLLRQIRTLVRTSAAS